MLDLTHALAGPYCTMLLGDLGADVIKLESPGGDHARHWGPPFIDGESSYFMSVNRNKRSVVLDLKQERARAAARALALASDVVVENYRPGTVKRFGLGHEELRAAKPELVYASISGFGQEHPELAGYDQIAQGTSGLMSLTGAPDGVPTKIGVPVGDVTAGMFTAHAVMAALLGRHRTGEGTVIDVALNDSLMALLTYQAGLFFATGSSPRREGNFHATIAPYGTFATRDGFINITVGSDAQFRVLCEAVGAPGLAGDQRFVTNGDRQKHRPELNRALEERLAEATTDEWRRRLGAAGVPAGPIHDVEHAFGDEVARSRGVRVDVDHPVGRIGQVAAPWRLGGEPFTVRRRPPLLGEHTAEVLREIAGYTDAEARELVAT